MDLIRRSDAIDALSRGSGCGNSCRKAIENLPSAEPQIIRCKDCKHYYYTDNRVFGERTWVCDILNFEDLDEDEFCARAERREEE